MEKLITLINEFCEKEYDCPKNRDEDYIMLQAEYVISKKYWFIQRLVDNDKIDWKADKIRKSQLCYLYDAEQLSIENSDFLIQLLSTQDNPVDFLIEILK